MGILQQNFMKKLYIYIYYLVGSVSSTLGNESRMSEGNTAMLVSTSKRSAALSIRYSVRAAELPYAWSATARRSKKRRRIPWLDSLASALPCNRRTAKRGEKEQKNQARCRQQRGRRSTWHNLKDWQPLPMLEMYVEKLKLQCLCTNLIFCETWTRSLLLLIMMMMYYSWPAMWTAWGRLLAVMFLTVVHHPRIHSSSFQ